MGVDKRVEKLKQEAAYRKISKVDKIDALILLYEDKSLILFNKKKPRK